VSHPINIIYLQILRFLEKAITRTTEGESEFGQASGHLPQHKDNYAHESSTQWECL